MTANWSNTALEAFHRYATGFRSLDPRAVASCFRQIDGQWRVVVAAVHEPLP